MISILVLRRWLEGVCKAPLGVGCMLRSPMLLESTNVGVDSRFESIGFGPTTWKSLCEYRLMSCSERHSHTILETLSLGEEKEQ